MRSERKHIDRLYMPDLIPVLYQVLQVAGQSRTGAADVNDTLRSHLYHGRKYVLLTALAWWVYDDDIGGDAFLFIFFR